jgi:hypothetical protein
MEKATWSLSEVVAKVERATRSEGKVAIVCVVDIVHISDRWI